MTLLYNLGIRLYSVALLLVSPFNIKAKLLRKGRRETKQQLSNISFNGPVVWVHAASLGEFEQGRPIIEAIKKEHPHYKVVLTFFSPSGYEIRKNYELADWVCYLPADTKRNARRFIQAINPEKVFFIKYEFWYHYLTNLKKANIPVYGVSTIFRREQSFFKSYGSWFKKMLHCFEKFYVQDEVSGELLTDIGIGNFAVAGDTRFDRVRDIAKASADVELARRFADGADKVIVAGSTWGPDEDILIEYLQNQGKNVKLIIAPHEIHDEHIRQIESKLKVHYFTFTNPPKDPQNFQVMIVNTMGMLSAIYKYGQVAYIGGGFGKGIHNTLEAATYEMPVFFGTNYRKFKEARDLIKREAAFSINDKQEFSQLIEKIWADKKYLESLSKNAGQYVTEMCGATRLIMEEAF
ncbi:MAG: 3-deoxy-D-manno-octulosonic acid transferase [Marinilabiliaceae bacterium]|nr:3-deoxy-D-manno-octulosonic acid transferase [Marinilabiliaceae bacterium]